MSYLREKLVDLTIELVRQQPQMTAAQVAERLQVHRHTLQRALKANGRSFALIKRAVVLERFEAHLVSNQVTSLKQVWTELGFGSASAFGRYLRSATGKRPSELRLEGNLGQFARKRSPMRLDVASERE
jgi:transcriptional regulator GlxA family with amidase domain